MLYLGKFLVIIGAFRVHILLLMAFLIVSRYNLKINKRYYIYFFFYNVLFNFRKEFQNSCNFLNMIKAAPNQFQ